MASEVHAIRSGKAMSSLLLTAPATRSRWGMLSKPTSNIARGRAHSLTARRLETGTRELGLSAQLEAGLAATAGDGHPEGGASGVVGARESRVQGEGKQEDDGLA